MLSFAFVGNYQQYPAAEDQNYWNVAIVDEETGLACPLETPVHCVCAEESSFFLWKMFFINFHSIPDLIFDSGLDESFGFV